MVLGGWGSVNLSHLFTAARRNSAALNKKGEVDRLQQQYNYQDNNTSLFIALYIYPCNISVSCPPPHSSNCLIVPFRIIWQVSVSGCISVYNSLC